MLRRHNAKSLLKRVKKRIHCMAVPAAAGTLLLASGAFAEEDNAGAVQHHEPDGKR